MDELDKKVDGTVEEEPKEVPAEEKKPEAKGTEKNKKAKKATLAQRAKTKVKENKKPIVAGAVGFVLGVGATLADIMFIGHKHRKAEAAAMREAPLFPEETGSPLDPNVE